MAFRIDPRWPHAARGPVQDVADITLSASGRVFSRLFDGHEGRVRDHVRASTINLAFWLADRWWRLRWEPIGDPRFVSPEWRMRHELSSASGDTLLPPFMIYGSGPRVMVAPIIGSGVAWGPIRYLEDRPVTVSAQDFETGVDDFFQTVLRVCGNHPDANALDHLVGQVARERDDDELAGWRRLEACLGYDPDQAPEAVINAMVDFEARIGETAIDEAAVAAPGEQAVETLQSVVAATEASDLVVDFSTIDGLIDPQDLSGRAPWQAAEDAATQLRTVLNLGATVSWQDLGDMLRTQWTALKTATATARGLPYAAMAEEDALGRLAVAMGPPVHRRFELARMIGDRIWTGEQNSFGVVSRARTDRQKFQRAFAQALLCPLEALREVVDVNQPTIEDIDRAARRFLIDRSAVIAVLRNHGYLPHETVADLLEAA